jgi:hypothetical protein
MQPGGGVNNSLYGVGGRTALVRPRICSHGHGRHVIGHESPMSPIAPLGPDAEVLERLERHPMSIA